MASEDQIHSVYRGLGSLYAAEHEEHDDDGAKLVKGLLKQLRKFARHEHQEHSWGADDITRGMFPGA